MQSIRIRVLSAIVITFILLFAALVFVARGLLDDSYRELENRFVQDNIQRVLNELEDEVADVSSRTLDYAYWDDTHAFASGELPDYGQVNFDVAAGFLVNLDNNFVIISDPVGTILFSQVVDLETGEELALPAGLLAYLETTLAQDPFASGQEGRDVSGLYRIPGGLIAVSTRAILLSNLQGEPAGMFTFGRFIDEAHLVQLSEGLRIPVSIFGLDDDAVPTDVAAARLRLNSDTPTLSQPLDDTLVAGYALLSDMNDRTIGIVRTEQPRDIWQQGQTTSTLLAFALISTGLILSLITYVALDRVVVSRITSLSNQVDDIRASSDLEQRLPVTADDEISRLGDNINHLLGELNATQKTLIKQNTVLEDALNQSREATRLKSEFLSTMSHELRTPLNAIIGYSGIMLRGINGELDDEATRMVGNIHDSSKHLLALVNDILDLSKIEAGRMELVEDTYSMRELVQDLCDHVGVLADQKALAFTTEVASDVPDALVGDHERLKQILINLLSNAIKFTAHGEVNLIVSRHDNDLVFQVSDTGVGIPPHALDLIFEEFRQVDASSRRAHRGTGLGLSIARKLAAAMKGTITVSSEVGVGSIFTVTLPLHIASPISSPERS